MTYLDLTAPGSLQLSAKDDLSQYGKDRLNDDYWRVQRRDGGKTSRTDFALGWMALAVRYKLWTMFTPEARARLEEPTT